MFSLLSLPCICKNKNKCIEKIFVRVEETEITCEEIHKETRTQESRENETCARGRVNLQQTHPRLTRARGSEKK